MSNETTRRQNSFFIRQRVCFVTDWHTYSAYTHEGKPHPCWDWISLRADQTDRSQNAVCRHRYNEQQTLLYESDGIFLTGDGSVPTIQGIDSEVRLQFDGFDEIDVTDTYSVTQAFYTGFFRLVGDDGKTYVGRFMELMCESADFTNYYYGNATNHITLSDEDPDYDPYSQGIEEIIANTKDGQKVLRNGQLLIIRDGKAFNALGAQIK